MSNEKDYITITDELVEGVAKWLGKNRIDLFKDYKIRYGTVSPVIPGKIPHPVHFREGMSVRNQLRKLTNYSWTAHQYDEAWKIIIEKVINKY